MSYVLSIGASNGPPTGLTPSGIPRNGQDPEAYIAELNRDAIAHSDEFYSYEQPKDFCAESNMLRFTSAVDTPYPENNTVHARIFPAKSKKAVVVLPHWNASLNQHNALCAGIARLGITALRLSLPYHDYRMPAELERADYAMSSNVARSIDATRQAVIDVRSCFDWLERQGYERLGIVGTSIGSCYAFLASAHDRRIAVNVFNHCSTYVADVVWTGLSTLHIRKGMEGKSASSACARRGPRSAPSITWKNSARSPRSHSSSTRLTTPRSLLISRATPSTAFAATTSTQRS